MCHQDQRGALFGIHGEHQVDDRRAGCGVEIAGRFIGQQQSGFGREGARQRDPLLFAAGQLARVVRHPPAQADPFQQCHRALAHPVDAGQFERQHDVFERGQRRQKLEGLEHEADLFAAQLGPGVFVERKDVLPGDADRAGRRQVEPGQKTEQGRFS